jgi:hypothetical protein
MPVHRSERAVMVASIQARRDRRTSLSIGPDRAEPGPIGTFSRAPTWWDAPDMVPVVLGAAVVVAVVVGIKALQSRSEPTPAPQDPPPPETDIADAGVPGGTG